MVSGATGGEFGVVYDTELFILSSYCFQVLLIIRIILVHIQFNVNSCAVMTNTTFGGVQCLDVSNVYIISRQY